MSASKSLILNNSEQHSPFSIPSDFRSLSSQFPSSVSSFPSSCYHASFRSQSVSSLLLSFLLLLSLLNLSSALSTENEGESPTRLEARANREAYSVMTLIFTFAFIAFLLMVWLLLVYFGYVIADQRPEWCCCRRDEKDEEDEEDWNDEESRYYIDSDSSSDEEVEVRVWSFFRFPSFLYLLLFEFSTNQHSRYRKTIR
jgi:hypothetical protein